MDQVAIVERLDTEVPELQVAFRDEYLPEPDQVEPKQVGTDQPQFCCLLDVARKGGRVELPRVLDGDAPAEDLAIDAAQERPGSDRRGDRVDLDPGPSGQHDRPVEVAERHPRMDRGENILFERLDFNPAVLLPLDGLGDPGPQQGAVDEEFLAGRIDDPEGVLIAATGAGFAVQDVAPGHGVRSGGHQLPLDFVLDLFHGGDRAAGPGEREGGQDRIGHVRDPIGHHGGERIGEGRTDLGPEGHLDRVIDPAPIERDLPSVSLADASAGEIGETGTGTHR